MTLRFLAIPLVVAIAACGPSVPSAVEAVGQDQSAIVGGATDTGDPAVVAVAVRAGNQFGPFCTGTLVAPQTVLTAAHCVNVYGPSASYYVLFGTSAYNPTSYKRVVSQTRHPQYNAQTNQDHDFGVLQLEAPVTNVTPIDMNPVPLTSADVGRAIRHAGFGVTSGTAQDSGLKRQVTYNVRQVSQWLIESGAPGKQTCSGDSGGPAFMETTGSIKERVVGVVSFGDQNCQMFGADGRVDQVLPWIRSVMNAWETPTCADDGRCKEGCMPVDQDCACAADGQCTAACTNLSKDPDCPKDCGQNGVCAEESCPVPDPDCVPVGGVCTSPDVCHDRACVGDAQHPGVTYCSKPCQDNGQCPGDMECLNLVCLYKQKPVKQLGEVCDVANEACAAGFCTGPLGGLTRCVNACAVTSDCAQGETCESSADSQRFCRPPSDKVSFSKDTTVPLAVAEGPAAAVPGCSSVAAGPALAWALAALLRRRRAR